MKIIPVFASILIATTSLSACKIVMNEEAKENTAVVAGAVGDDDRIAALLAETYDAKLIPHLTDNAQDLATLRKEMNADLNAAGEKFGNRGAGKGAAWNFPINEQGAIVATKLDSRARTLDVDVDGDATADFKVQLGPVVKGTALRDAAPFYDFNDFRDQIEFAKLARAINDRITAQIEVPEGDLIGEKFSVTGVFAVKSATDAVLVTPITVEFGQ